MVNPKANLILRKKLFWEVMKAKKTRLSRKKRVALEGWLRKERVRLEKRPLLKTAILEMAIQKRPAPKMKYGAKTKLMPNEREHCPTLVSKIVIYFNFFENIIAFTSDFLIHQIMLDGC